MDGSFGTVFCIVGDPTTIFLRYMCISLSGRVPPYPAGRRIHDATVTVWLNLQQTQVIEHLHPSIDLGDWQLEDAQVRL